MAYELDLEGMMKRNVYQQKWRKEGPGERTLDEGVESGLNTMQAVAGREC